MRVGTTVVLCLLLCLGAVRAVMAADEAALAQAINAYRSAPQACAGQAWEALPPLAIEPRLALPVGGALDWQQALARSGYSAASAKTIGLSGPVDAPSAMAALAASYCQVLLDPQFVDLGISHAGTAWRIVLARPLLAGHLGDAQAEGQQLLALINEARAQPRDCGDQPFGAAPSLVWNAVLASTAEAHSRAMANGNFFAHVDPDGHTPGDRAELAGYEGRQIGENIAAGLDSGRKVLDGWLASPGHCANLMNPQFREMGAGYASDPKSDAGIYWTALFGAP